MPIEKTLKIEQAKEGESLGIKTLSDYNSTGKESGFKKELEFYGVSDIFIDAQIKKDGSKYIFIIKNQPRFLVDEGYLVPWIQKFYTDRKEKEKLKTEETIYIRLSEIKGEQVLEGIKGELKDLKKDIEATQKKVEVSTNIEEVKNKVERLITFFEQEKDLAKDESAGWIFIKKYDRKDKGLRKIQKVEIDRRLKELNKIKEQIERLANNKNKKYEIERDIDAKDKTKKEIKKIKEVKMDDINALDMKITLLQLSQRIEDLGKEAPEFIKTRNDLITENGDITPYYELIINNVKDAQKLKEAINKVNDDYVMLNKMELPIAKRQALQQDLKALSEYLEKYINNPNTFDMAKEPFVFTSGDAIKELYKINPGFQKLIEGNIKAGSRKNNGEPKQKKLKIETIVIDKSEMLKKYPETDKDKTGVPKNISNFADKDYIETFKEGGAKGAIRKTFNMFPNMSNEAKNTRTNLLVVGGVGFGVFKLAKWLLTGRFGKKGEGKDTPFWQRVLIAGGITLGFNAFGSNPFTAAEKFIGGGLDPGKLKLQWPGATTEVINNPDEELNVIELNEIFGTLPAGELKKFIDPKTFKMTEAGHNGLLLNFQGDDANSKAKRDLIEKIWKNNDKDILKTSFAKLGITPENISNLNQNKTIKEYTEGYLPTLETSDRDNIDDPRINITEQVKNFNINEEQKKNLIKYGNILYDEKPSSSKQKVEFKEKDTRIYLKTYGERTPIDSEKLTIPGYQKEDTSPIVFSGYQELLKAANFTNYMKSIFRGKAKGEKYEPFETAGLAGKLTWDRGDIMFNDGTHPYNPVHTEAIDGGRFGTLGKISKKLEDNREEYIKYLNKLNIWNEKRATESKPD